MAHRRRRSLMIGAGMALVLLALPAVSHAAEAGAASDIIERGLRVLTLRDYNTRVVLIGTTLLGVGAGIIGTFLLLRRRALMGDVLSHATLPGIGIAFILLAQAGGTGKSLPALLLGGLVTGIVGMGCVLLIRKYTRVKEDAALGIVLSVFFGLGVAILSIIQKMQAGHAAGLESFIYGKTAAMLWRDAMLIAAASGGITVICVLLFKEFNLLCFDAPFAGSQGWPVLTLDVLLLALVAGITVIGLQAVGLILMIALLVIPPAASTFWTYHLRNRLILSAVLGGLSGLLGAGASALVPRLPAGAIIVLVAALLFGVSMVFGTARGMLGRWREQRRLNSQVHRQHLLRALFEVIEPRLGEVTPGFATDAARLPVPVQELQRRRSWSHRALERLLARAERIGLVCPAGAEAYRLTDVGWREAYRVVRNHRLWELYLIEYAEIAPAHVDRGADALEDVLDPHVVAQLERVLAKRDPRLALPASPHYLPADPHAGAGVAGGG